LGWVCQYLVHQARYRLNPNYVAIVKQNINKLLIGGFIKHVEEATWLSPIVVMPKKIKNSEFVWILKSLMLPQRKINTRYLLLMRLLIL
jgi:hypothetical protein